MLYLLYLYYNYNKYGEIVLECIAQVCIFAK